MKRQVVAVFLAMAMLLVVSFAAMAATKGDVNGINGVEIGDAVAALQVSAGPEEAIYALQVVAGVRQVTKGRAVLGHLAGADVTVYRLSNSNFDFFSSFI